jgi:dihydrofolate reductase
MNPNHYISIIAAIGKNRELGLAGQLLWHIGADMKHFKKITAGHPVIMGRKTWESLPERFRPLPGRTNIVVTRQEGYGAVGSVVASSLEEARSAAARAPGSEEVFVIGGGELYREALPFADRLYLTLVDDSKESDTFFPEYEKEFEIISKEPGEGELQHCFLTLERR